MEPDFPTLDTIKGWSAILAAHQWPILILALVLLFREEIRKAVDLIARRIKSYKGFGGEFELGDLLPDKQTQLFTPTTPNNWGNVDDVYWLAHNLEAAIAFTIVGGPGHLIVEGLRLALKHLRRLPFSGTTVEVKLKRIISEAEGKLVKDWTAQARYDLLKEVRTLIDEVSDILEKQQKSSQSSSTTG